jgi:hypothetical protein
MKIAIADGLLYIDNDAVKYDQQYLSKAVLSTVIQEWRQRLGSDMHSRRPVYLPFSIDEEFVHAFEAEETNDSISLRVVQLDAIGFVPGVDPLIEEILNARRVVSRAAKQFLVCERSVLVNAIDNFLTEVSEYRGS